jgi:tetratricopeptide (TPR) repeat protein
VPFEKNPSFTGRESLLAQLEQKLDINDQPTKVAVYGLGGVGKTQLVIELAHRVKKKKPKDCSVIWIPAANMASLEQGYLDAARQLGIPNLDEPKTDVRKLVQTHLSQESAGQWLLILDNADDLDMWTYRHDSVERSGRLIDCLPRSEQGCIVFTTRDKKTALGLAPHQNIIEMKEMDEAMATRLLRKLSFHQELVDNEQDAKALLEQLTYLPLPIAQAAAYINENGITLADYLSLLAEQEEEVVKLLSKEFEVDGKYSSEMSPVAKTWLISFERIRVVDPLAADWLSLMSCIDAKNVPKIFLPPGSSKRLEIEAIGTLRGYSFVNERSGESALDVHRLVHLATRNWLRGRGELVPRTEKAIARLLEELPFRTYENRHLWRKLRPHANYALASNVVHQDDINRNTLAWKCGGWLYSEGRYEEAKVLFLQVTETNSGILGPNASNTLDSLIDLARAYEATNELEVAEAMIKRVTEAVGLDEGHPTFLYMMFAKARILFRQERWHEAEDLLQRMVQLNTKEYGREHPNTLSTRYRLALTFLEQHREREGEILLNDVMETSLKVSGESHFITLVCMKNLAELHFTKGRDIKEAEALFKRAIALSATDNGRTNLITMEMIRILARQYRRQGRLQDAE